MFNMMLTLTYPGQNSKVKVIMLQSKVTGWNNSDSACECVGLYCCRPLANEFRQQQKCALTKCCVARDRGLFCVVFQGCHTALVDWLNRYQYFTSCFFIIIVLQVDTDLLNKIISWFINWQWSIDLLIWLYICLLASARPTYRLLRLTDLAK